MAVDEAVAESVRAGGPPVLRFYGWAPGCLSLGRFQNLADGLTEEARSGPLVRRMTGGGGIWHDDELTYSLACAAADLPDAGVKASFERLCGFLVDTWRSLGWDAGFAKDTGADGGPLGAYTPACFAGREEYDILVGGRKLGGNAQRRDRGLVFQHGSVPRKLDRPRLDRLFLEGFRPEAASTTDLAGCGWTGPAEALIPRLQEAFLTRLGAAGEASELTAAETEAAGRAAADRYADREWTENGGGTLRPVSGA